MENHHHLSRTLAGKTLFLERNGGKKELAPFFGVSQEVTWLPYSDVTGVILERALCFQKLGPTNGPLWGLGLFQ